MEHTEPGEEIQEAVMTYFRRSLHPPTDGDAGLADGARPGWVLLDFKAFLPEQPHRNATAASCRTGYGGREIEVSFFPAPPPRVSYFCVNCPGAPGVFATEPKVVATDGKFLLLSVNFGDCVTLLTCSSLLREYYVYRAGDGGASLEPLDQPGLCRFIDAQVGLLSRGDEYTVVALVDDARYRGLTVPAGRYEVFVRHSESKVWTINHVTVPPEQVQEHSNFEEGFLHLTSEVIVIGGKFGTMAFVDLWRGILLYDVFAFADQYFLVENKCPILRYVALPHQLHNRKRPYIGPHISRNIALVQGRIKFVEIQIDSNSNKFYRPIHRLDGWVASTWSRMATFPEGDSWCPHDRLEASDIVGENSPLHIDIRQRLLDEGGKPLSFESLYIGFPTVSLDDDDIVYFMIQADQTYSWVTALDMSTKMLKGWAEIRAPRSLGISFTYIPSRISKYLNMAPGTKGKLKRPGILLSGACGKKPYGSSSVGSTEAENDGSII